MNPGNSNVAFVLLFLLNGRILVLSSASSSPNFASLSFSASRTALAPASFSNMMIKLSAYRRDAQRIAESDSEQLKSMTLRIAKRPSSLKTTDLFNGFNWDKFIEHQKSSVQCKVEHAFLIVKRDFGYRKVA